MIRPRTCVDRVYVATSARDARYARICVASIRRFYPDVSIRLLVGGSLQKGLAVELERYWGVQLSPFPAGDYGWGFVKLEPLFGPPGERFLVLDADTVLTGPVLDLWADRGAAFVVDDEPQSEVDTRRLYYDWRGIRQVDPRARPPRFVFNSGQWFGTAGVLTRDDFSPWVEWTMPRTLRYPEQFMPGDQGILNYVLNRKVVEGAVRVERRQIMRWPGHGMKGLDVAGLSDGSCQWLVVHWAGMKTTLQRNMAGADLLGHFEKEYYRRLPVGALRRPVAAVRHALTQWRLGFRDRVTVASRRLPRRPHRIRQWA